MRLSPGVNYTRVGESKKSGNRRCIKIPQKGHAGSGVCRTSERDEDSRDVREESEKNEAGARAEAHRPQQLQCQRGLAGHTCKSYDAKYPSEESSTGITPRQDQLQAIKPDQIKVTNDTRVVRGQRAIYAKDFSSSPNFTTVICTLKHLSLLHLALGTVKNEN
jgi:hypothetical protein